MGGANRDVARDEEADSQEGRTGVQASFASGSSVLRSSKATAVATAATSSNGEKRFTTTIV